LKKVNPPTLCEADEVGDNRQLFNKRSTGYAWVVLCFWRENEYPELLLVSKDTNHLLEEVQD
jgi:hypothetical protein